MGKPAHIYLPDGRRLDFAVQVSGRRKTVGLKVAPTGLTVTVPPGLPDGRITEIVGRKAEWIMSKLQELGEVSGSGGGLRPEAFDLPAIAESWRVEYREASGGDVTARTGTPGSILVSGAVGDAAMCRAALRRWLALRAREAMGVWLDLLARETGFGFRKLTVRNQRTRWGSCSAGGVISLNCVLLFLPPAWVRYVMIHELCHVPEPNHSARFWSLVGRFEPGHQAIRRGMRDAWRQIPAWANPLGGWAGESATPG